MWGSKRFIVALGAIGLLATASEASPPILEPPSPCPCCADGACYPKRETWGHYKRRWRKWPTDTRPDIPGTDEPDVEGQFPPELPSFDAPPAELEERRAPESFKERQERIRADQLPLQQPGAGGPPVQPLPPLPAAPNGPGPGGFNFDQPPRPPGNAPLGPAPPLDQPAQPAPLEDFQLPFGPNGDLQGQLDLPPSLPQGLARQAVGGNWGEGDRDAVPALPAQLIRRTPIVSRIPAQGTGGRLIPASATESPAGTPPQVGRAVYQQPAAIR